MNKTILLVDDEEEILELVEIYLHNESFRVVKATNGQEALEKMNEHTIDLVILDQMMPVMDGITACTQIRKKFNTPIIMLSAKNDAVDKISGLSMGADDYVGKPFIPMELIARVKSQLRRTEMAAPIAKENENEIVVDELKINTACHEITVRGQKVSLTPTEFGIVEALARNKGHVLSMKVLYETVWNQTFYEAENTVMVHVRKVREKIEENPKQPRYIKTVWGVGYKMDV